MLVKRAGTYYFRYWVPVQHREVWGCTEYKRSLKTSDRRVAKMLALSLLHQVEQIQHAWRLGMLNYDQIEAMVSEFRRKTLIELSEARRERGISVYIPPAMASDHDDYNSLHRKVIEYHKQLKSQLNQKVQSNQLEDERIIAKRLLDEAGLVEDETSPSFRLLCEYIIKNKISISNTIIRRMLGDYSTEPENLEHRPQQTTQSTISKMKLSDLWEEHKQEAEAKKRWRQSTKQKNESTAKQLFSILGDKPLATYDKTDALKIIDILSKSGKSVATVNYTVELASSLWKRALKHPTKWGVEYNPFSEMQVKDDREDRDKRLPYTHEDLQGIFAGLADRRKVRREVEPEKLWIPLIALYSGMRLNEASQLRLVDIEETDGIWMFCIRHDAKYHQSTKNGKSRNCPIHPTLIKAGFLKYVDSRRAKGKDRLFENVFLSNERWGKKAGDWWNRTFLKKVVKDKKSKSFHSTRHTFINWFVQNVKLTFSDLNVLKSIVGHLDGVEAGLLSSGGITTDIYSSEYPPKTKLALLKKLDYGIDIVLKD